MANPFLIRLIIQFGSSVGKSIFKAYQKTVKNSGAGQHAKQQNPFGDFLNKTMSGLNITHTKMHQDEAAKILQIEVAEINPNSILDAYYRMYEKNSLKNGGSFYVQSKIFNAKELLIAEFPGAEEEYKKEKGMEKENEGEQKQEEESEKKEEKNEKTTTEQQQQEKKKE